MSELCLRVKSEAQPAIQRESNAQSPPLVHQTRVHRASLKQKLEPNDLSPQLPDQLHIRVLVYSRLVYDVLGSIRVP